MQHGVRSAFRELCPEEGVSEVRLKKAALRLGFGGAQPVGQSERGSWGQGVGTGPTSHTREKAEVLTAGRAKKETPIKEKVAAIRRPSHVLGVLSP